MRSLGLCLVALGILVLAGDGCIFDPASTHKPPPGGGGQELVVAYSPENALRRLEYAYSHRDSVLIKDIYDSTYVGTSTDLTAPPESQILNFSYVDEVEHVATLERSHTVTSVLLTFGALNRLASDDASHPDWALIQMPGSQVQLDVEDSTSYALHATGETFKFKFRPITPANTPSDTLWRIVRWEELYVGGT